MRSRTGIEKRFYEICLQVVKEEGLELYDLDYISGSTTLCLYIMNSETKSADIDECVRINKALAPIMEEDWVPEKLTVEVSSPGVFRKLSSARHFNDSVGENVEITFIKKLSADQLPKKLKGQKKVIAKLERFEDQTLSLMIDDYDLDVQIKDLKKVTLHPDIND